MIFVALTVKSDEHQQREPDVYNENARESIDKPVPNLMHNHGGQLPFIPPSNWHNGINAFKYGKAGTIKKGPSWKQNTAKSMSSQSDQHITGAINLHEQMKAERTGFDSNDFQTLANSTDEWEIRKAIDRIFKAMDFDLNGELSFTEIGVILQKFLL